MTPPLLFTPLQLRGASLRNRVVVSPMHQYSAVKGYPTDWHLMTLGRYAAGGAGLVFAESTKVERRGCGTVGDLGIWHDGFVPHLKRLVEFVHAHGAVAGIQLGHSGRKSRLQRPWEGSKPLEPGPEIDDWDEWELVAPSAVPAGEGAPVPRELTIAEIHGLAEAWARAAARADAAGFDVVEIHAAHGYLLHQFLSPEANRRSDAYGGSKANRMRLAVEVAEAVRAVWPEEKPLFMRLSVEDDAGWGPEESVALARLLKPVGVDVIDCSSGGIRGRPNDSAKVGYGYQVPYAEKIRREAGIMTMAVGLIVHHDQAEEILRNGRADLIALAREILYNPNWPIDAAQKMGLDPGFTMAPPPYAWWLSRRKATMPEIVPSTWGRGMGETS